SRNKNDPAPVPMAGVPHHSAKRYIAKLINAGYKVAVCDQVEDPAQAKGIVKREVTQVITPGMLTDDSLLDERTENLTLAACLVKKQWGLASLDISTGLFRATVTADLAQAIAETGRLAPAEILLPQSAKGDLAFAKLCAAAPKAAVTHLEDSFFNPARAASLLEKQFATKGLDGFGLADKPAAIAACGAALSYAGYARKQEISHLDSISFYSLDGFLWLDAPTVRNLELLENLHTKTRQGSLLAIVDQCATSIGSRLVRQWLRYPLLNQDAINQRLDAVAALFENQRVLSSLRELLDSVCDMERLRSRISLNQANARDLLSLKESIERLPAIYSLVAENFSATLLAGEETDDCLDDINLLIGKAIAPDPPPTIREGGFIARGFNAELDELRTLAADAKGFIARMEADQKAKLGISALKVRFNKVFGYFIEVPKAHAEKMPPNFVRKQTLVNAERYITDELKQFEDKVLGAEERMAALEYELFCQVRDAIVAQEQRIGRAARKIALIDAAASLAHAARQNRFVRPEIGDDTRLEIEEGRHPVVEKSLPGQRFVPNSIFLDNESNQILIITGPNMAGKSTVLRQAAVTVIMAQMGGFVPAKSARIGLVDRIFTRVGALDDLAQGRSTFLVEMQETANILHNATPKSLVILDEMGRGTSTYDGLSLAWAVVEYLHEIQGQGVKTLFATHYHELTALAKTMPRVKNFHIMVREWGDEVIFLHTLAPGDAGKSHGIAVARLAGVPKSILKRAASVLSQIEAGQFGGLASKTAPKAKKAAQGATQLPLFPTTGQWVMQTLEELDINSMTPIEAINTLSALKERLCRKENTKDDGQEQEDSPKKEEGLF
ncbi:MAG: DNA mismatch repair protein MutS, partial [Desulfatibacillaceae bacterium]|nr:DNA mismatch repair protein MutS [Desulfatibacillaceae bacterium]